MNCACQDILRYEKATGFHHKGAHCIFPMGNNHCIPQSLLLIDLNLSFFWLFSTSPCISSHLYSCWQYHQPLVPLLSTSALLSLVSKESAFLQALAPSKEENRKLAIVLAMPTFNAALSLPVLLAE
jgi:hypothetical protein